MNEQTRRRLGTLALCLGLAALHFILLLTAVHWVGTDAALYYSLQTQGGEQYSWDTEMLFSVSQEDLKMLDGCLADYLKGNEGALDVTVSVYGTPREAFNDQEKAHMADCLYLFDLLRKVRARLIPWIIVLILGGAWLLQDRKRARLCAWLSPLIVLVPLIAFAVCAILNFDRAFTLFHKILFRNDLWLLDPTTDLLIRLCPQYMFVRMGVRIALYSLLSIAMATLFAVVLTYEWPKGKEENPWKTTTRRAPAPRQYDFGSRAKR